VLRRGRVVTRTSPAEKCRRRVNQIALEALSRQPQEAAMSIVRLIHIKIDPTEMDRALRVWKTECAPLMIQQKGCISEKLLRCREAHELISYSEWDSEADIELYRASDAHKEIVRHARTLKGSKAEVKLYDLVT
jgi:heme-degrading monooxygenase HmoA